MVHPTCPGRGPRPRNAGRSAPGQQNGHLDWPEQVALWFGQQTVADALVQRFNDSSFRFGLFESRPHHRLGDGTQEASVAAGVSRQVAAALEPRSRTVTGRAGLGHGSLAAASPNHG